MRPALGDAGMKLGVKVKMNEHVYVDVYMRGRPELATRVGGQR